MSTRTNVGADDAFFSFLATSSGGIDMNVAGSSAAGAVTFSVSPATSKGSLEIHRINFELKGTDAFYGNLWGTSLSALTNGVKVQVVNSTGGEVFDFMNGQTLVENNDWGYLAGSDVVVTPATSAGATRTKLVRWTLANAGAPLRLGVGQKIQVTIQDDISSSGVLTGFRGMAQGIYTE